MATVRYFAAARAAAGRTEESIDAVSLDDLVTTAADRHGERLALVLKACSFLVDGLSCRDGATALDPSSTVDVLPPFAGG
ncbi:MAG TPA: MoaD/ThiS family protein [Rugosimonospora sp.]|nr:MoaD/ThiS family protein [Rugosimonospora sp.]